MSTSPFKKDNFFSIILFALMLGTFVRVGAQSPTPTPRSSQELQDAIDKRALLDAQKDIANDEKAIRDAKFPAPSTTPLAGTTTISDGAIIESQMVAYAAMARAANKLVLALKHHPHQIDNLAIFNEGDVKLLLSYKVARKQVEMLVTEYERLLATSVTTKCAPEAAASPGPSPQTFIVGTQIARSFLGSFVDLTALLRTNVEIKGQSFDIDEAPLVSEVFRASRCQFGNIKLYYPAVFPPDINPEKKYEILAILNQLHCLRVEAGKLIADIAKNEKDLDDAQAKVKAVRAAIQQNEASQEADQAKLRLILRAHCRKASGEDSILDEQLAKFGLSGWLIRFCPALPPDQRERLFNIKDEQADLASEHLTLTKTKLPAAQQDVTRLQDEQKKLFLNLQSNIKNPGEADDAAAQLKALNDQFDKLIDTFTKVETAASLNQLTTFIKAENLSTALPAAGSYWLQLKVVKAGGNNRIKTNLLWDIFTGGNRVSHSGGAIIEYVLYDTAGRSVASDTLTEYTNYIKADRIKNLANSSIDDQGCDCQKCGPDCSKAPPSACPTPKNQ